jgi:flavin reductase (DIM6/NTAB) family NADH-FMN oxidoreductase RutF
MSSAPERAGRLEIDIGELSPRQVYPWLTASIIPRAIAWVSTLSAAGVPNVAPHSFTTVAGRDPATLCFVSVGHKDTLANIRATGEFVLCIATASMLTAMNDSATNFPADVDEFEAVGLESEPSTCVRPSRVADVPVAFECRVSGEHEIGDCVMVFGEVLHISARQDVLADDGLPDARAVAPLARLGRAHWSTLGEVIDLPRIRWESWQDGVRGEPDR